MDKRIDLNGMWEFTKKNDNDWKEGVVPGCVQLDLIRLKELPNPFYGLNEIHFNSLEEEEWIYRKEFKINIEDLNSTNIDILFEGLDTFAKIYINNKHIGYTENMYIPHSFNIKKYLIVGINYIEVHFDSSIKRAKTLMNVDNRNLGYSSEPSAPYIRKAHYSFGWDWCPRMLQVGIWRPVYIELNGDVEINNAFCYTKEIGGQEAQVHVEASINNNDIMGLLASITICIDETIVAKADMELIINNKVSTDIIIPDVQLWFPNGLGEQPMYKIEIAVIKANIKIVEYSFETGIRKVKLLKEKDNQGESFIFEVNGQKVFAKGANWLPGDNLLPRMKKEDYYEYVRLAKEANMNMFLCWGGGIYEDPEFYNACDEMGIMVFQTFMFHYAEYPAWDEKFISNISNEAKIIVKQLRNHPSIVLWCGECENAWSFPSEDKNRGSKIYKEILPRICKKLDPSRDYHIGTPSGGEEPNSMNEGDRHSWDVYMGFKDYETFLDDTTRFASEFGIQSMPNWKTILEYTPEKERNLYSATTLSHNKFPNAMEMLFKCIFGMVGIPKDFRSFVYLSQFTQAEIMKLAIENWRKRMFLTGGTLFWQYNDSWPGTSFSCIDYSRRRKYLYYYSKRFYAMILPYLKQTKNGIDISVISDYSYSTDAKIKVSCYRLNGIKLSKMEFDAVINGNNFSNIKSISFKELGIEEKLIPMPKNQRYTKIVKEKNSELDNVVVFIDIVTKEETFTNYLMFNRFKYLKFSKANIDVKINGNLICLSTDVPTFGVFIDTQNDVVLSDNALTMKPGEVYNIECSDVPGDVEINDIQKMINFN